MQNKKIANRLQNSYVRRYVLTGGKEAGIKVVELGCGVMRATINENDLKTSKKDFPQLKI